MINTNLHTKGAEAEILALIKKYNLKTPIIHWYNGSLEILKELLDYGCFFTISVDIGYSKTTEEIVKYLPIDRILTETDGLPHWNGLTVNMAIRIIQQPL